MATREKNMQAAASIYQLAHQYVAQLHAMLDDIAQMFNATFAVSNEEVEALDIHPELHAAGPAIELSLSGQDITFSFSTVSERESKDRVWELLAYHGQQTLPERVCIMRVGPTSSERARRLRGARLVAAIGDYLERHHPRQSNEEAIAGVLAQLRMDTSVTWLPQIAASHRVYQA
jgi:hypothetical protein